MKRKLLFAGIIFSAFIQPVSSQICNPNGNLIIFSNYDGGTLNINVDVNIPNLKLGIISYEAVDVNISGAFAGNITAVEWAGYNAANGHCVPNITNTVVNGVSAGIVTYSILPAATYSDPDGYSSIVCAYQCGAGNQGGCNTAIQITDYFLTSLGGTLYYHYLQYGCWSGTQNVSAGGNCCDQPAAAPVADFSWSPSGVCAGDCVTYTDQSVNNPTSWSWTFSGGNPATSALQNPVVCYSSAGTYPVSLTASNSNGSNTTTFNLQVNIADPSVSVNGATLTALQSGASYQWIDCNNGNTAVAGATLQSFTASVSGSYALVISSANCSDTSSCLDVTIGNSVNEFIFSQYASVYPNPASEVLNILLFSADSEGRILTIENSTGQIIYSENISNSKMEISLEGYPSGIYFIRMDTSRGMMSKKFIRQ